VSIFRRYADYYDLIHRDKDYAGESAFVRQSVRAHAPAARSVLDLGCGTARHAREWVRRGWRVLAVDRSAHRIRRARVERARLPARLRQHLRLAPGDVCRFDPGETFDAVLALFHVVNYQTTNAGLRRLFRTARAALRPGGVFLFDFWNGPAVRATPPEIRVKRVESRALRVMRLAEPVHDPKRHCVNVKFSVYVSRRPHGRTEQFTETHAVRYLFLPEIRRLASETNFRLTEAGEWLTRKPLSDGSWLGYAVLRAVERR